jgi:TonB family protein
MFENFVDAGAKPRYRPVWASVLLHGFAVAFILLLRWADAPRYMLIPVVHAENVELIMPAPPMDRLVVTQPHRAVPEKVASPFTPAVNRDLPVSDEIRGSVIPAATVSGDLLVPGDEIDPGSFQPAKPSIATVPQFDLPEPVIAKPIAPEEVRDKLPPKPPQVELPRPISQVSPVYPEVARLKGVQGSVELDAIVDERGFVTEVKIVRGNSLLNDAALECVRKWRYSPALVNGHVVPAPLHIVVRFQLKF